MFMTLYQLKCGWMMWDALSMFYMSVVNMSAKFGIEFINELNW